MDDFTLSMHFGYPTQEVIVGGSPTSIVPDISHFVNEEVIIPEHDEDCGATSSSSEDGGTVPIPGEHEILQMKTGYDDHDDSSSSNDARISINLDKMNRSSRKDIKHPSLNSRNFVFVTEDGKTAERLEDSEGVKSEEVTDMFAKPKMSYAQLIAEALMTDSDRMLTLAEIYTAINKLHPYYSLDATTGRNWQNAIRHNLTLNKAFTKIPRPASEGRGSYWKLEIGAESQIFRRVARSYRPKVNGISGSNHVYRDEQDNTLVYITV